MLTPLQEDERKALTGDRGAMLRVVSGLREYRAILAELTAARRDGDHSVESMAMSHAEHCARYTEGIDE